MAEDRATPDQDRRHDEDQPTIDTAEAATRAARDAESAARSAHEATAAAASLRSSAHLQVDAVRTSTAQAVAIAAATAADLAAEAAVAVMDEATSRAETVAAAAVRALEAVAADLGDDVDREEAREIAAAVAGRVAAAVIAQARLTDEAAVRVADAVTLAAEAAALAALAAAAVVAAAAATARARADDVVRTSSSTRAASGQVVSSTARVAELALDRLALLRRAPLVDELDRALEQDELLLHYQPMYSLETGAVVAVEALLRWQHPTRGLLFPAAFLDVAEGPHLVDAVGDWVLHAAVDQALAWQALLPGRAPTVWANISCDQLGRGRLLELVESVLLRTPLAPGALGLELTERQLARRIDDVEKELAAVHDLGVLLAVDDFGTGYASLDYLRRFTFDEIKIDRSFVSGHQDRTNAAVTASIVALGRHLGLQVVAEGVETVEQHELVTVLGCHVAQGYLMHRPAPGPQVTDLLVSGDRFSR